MKRHFLFLVFLFFHAQNVFCQQKKVDQKWQDEIIGSLEKSSYFFKSVSPSKKESVNEYFKFNTVITPLRQQINNTSDADNFSYSLNLTSIQKGNYFAILNDSPLFIEKEETLSEQHTDFTIEYINSVKGLKQNFIINNKIQHAGKLFVQLNFESKKSKIELINGEILIKGISDSKVQAKYNGLKVYDANKLPVDAKFKLIKNTITIEVNDLDAIFPLTIDPISTTASLQVIGTQAQAQLGYSVSTAGDVNGDGFTDVIVGAPKFDNPTANEGAAFVYYGSANGLSSSPAWTVDGGGIANTNFGVSVSEAGDVNGDGYGDVIVGAETYDNGAAEIDEGKIYVFHGSAGGLSLVADWTYEANQAGANLGFIVSTAGDVNADGFSDIIAGAPTYNNGTNKEGIAVVFHGSGTGLALAPAVTLDINVDSACFGWSVSTAGDVNSDGFDDVIVSGAYYDDNISTKHEGIAKVYHGAAGGINPVAVWTMEGNQTKCYFGENVSWAGDVNGDGYGDVIVGADYYDNGTSNEGAAFVYHGSAAGLGVSIVTLDANKSNSLFGVGVNGAGDVNGDGYGDVVVGAYNYTGTGGSAESVEGATFVYYGSSTGLSATLFTKIESNAVSASAGISVCSAGDVNGDGFSDIISGAYLFDKTSAPIATNAGCFYIFHGVPDGIGTTSIPAAPYTLAQASAGLGNFVTGIGDVNADGYSDMAVGASLFDIGAGVGVNRGVVYIFHGSSAGYSAVPATTINGPASLAASSLFGCSIGAAGDVNGDGYSDIIIGASGFTNGQATEGYFSIHLGSAAGITVAPHLAVESNLASAQLGFSVAGAGDVNGDGYSDVIVGANTYNSGTANEGKVFVYHGSSTGVNNVADWTYETNVNEKLGACVAGVGDCDGDGYSDVIALSSDWTNGQTLEGRMVYFRGSATGLELTPGTTTETNVANSLLGPNSTSYIGDLNGDGYNDVVIGVSTFNGGSVDEGELIILYGAYPSLYFGTTQILEGNAASFFLGKTVGFGGDVNGDGYNDIITGAQNYSNAEVNEGVARVYLGGPVAVGLTPYYTFEINVTLSNVGSSVSAVGDNNGDGYSDIAIGANGFDIVAGAVNVGRVYVFNGNNSHGILAKPFITQQFQSTFANVVQSSNGTFELSCSWGVRHFDKHHLGKGRGKLAWEIKGHQDPFNNYATAIANSVTFSGLEAAFSDLGLAGNTMSPQITAAGLGFPKWRARTKFHVIDALDGQMHGRWFYAGIHDKQDRSIKISITCGALPIELTSLQVNCIDNKSMLEFQVMSEENIAQYKIFGSQNGLDYNLISLSAPDLTGNYSVEIPNDQGFNYIRLEVIDNNNFSKIFDKKISNCFLENNSLTLFPNPTSATLNVQLDHGDEVLDEVQVLDLSGKIVLKTNSYHGGIDISMLPPGIYYVMAFTKSGKQFSSRFSHL